MTQLQINGKNIRKYKNKKGRGDVFCGRGRNGQRSRAGFSQSPLFQGGQFRYFHGLPQRGFSSNKKVYSIILFNFIKQLFKYKYLTSDQTLDNNFFNNYSLVLESIKNSSSISNNATKPFIKSSLFKKNIVFYIKVVRNISIYNKEESDNLLASLKDAFDFDNKISFFKSQI